MEAGAFASLVTDDKIPEVVFGIEQTVALSFAEDRAPGRVILVTGVARISKDEMNRRVKICIEIFRTLRGDLKWTIARIIDHLPEYLRKTLDGVAWEPDAKRASWMTSA